MRLSVRHVETFTFATPSLGTIQVGRLTPRDHSGHYVCNWTVEVDADCQTSEHTDAFGNIVTTFSVAGPLESLTLRAFGEVETEQNHGIIRGTADKVPHGVFLRSDSTDGVASVAGLVQSVLTTPDRETIAQLHEAKDLLHAALLIVRENTSEEETSNSGTRVDQSQKQQSVSSAAETKADDASASHTRVASALVQHRLTGSAETAAIFCEIARQMGHPARLVSGYRFADEGQVDKQGRDVWAEAYLEDLGWIGFDIDAGTCPSEDAIRVAVGLDEPGVAPLRFSHHGSTELGERETHIRINRVAS